MEALHGTHSNRLYLTVWSGLLVLTIAEVILAYMALSVGLMLTLLISFSLLKTALIVAYFMHLRFEKLSLTLTLILWFIYLAYLMIRAQDLEPEKKARYSAVLGIVGAISIPVNHFSVMIWRTIHPKPVVLTEQGIGTGLSDPMFLVALGLTFLALLAAFAALARQRVVLEELRDEAERLRFRLDDER